MNQGCTELVVTGQTRHQQVAFYINTFTIQLITLVLRPTAIYRALELNVPAVGIGALGASFAVAPLLLAVPSGQITDRFGERRVMISGAALAMAATLMFAFFAGNVWWLVAASVCLGTGHLGCVVSQQALVANRTLPNQYDAAFGHYTVAAAAGQTVGPGLIILFSEGAAIPNTSAIFNWCAAMSLVLLASSLWAPRRPQKDTRPAGTAGSTRQLLRRPGLLRAITVSAMVTAAVDITLIYLPVLGTERNISAGVVGILLTTRAAASMVSRLFLGQLAERLGWTRLLTGSIGIATISMALVASPVPIWVLTVAVAALGLGLGCGQPLTMSWLAETAPPGLRGRAMSLRLTGNRLGQVVVPSVAGTLAVAAGATGVLWLTAAGLAAVGLTSRGLRPASKSPDGLS